LLSLKYLSFFFASTIKTYKPTQRSES